MPSKQRHRGRRQEDTRLFSAPFVPILREAVRDLSYLLGRDYAEPSALKVVGDRYQLTVRQRRAVLAASCSDASLARRGTRRVEPADLRGRIVRIDGYNVLITVESALSGGFLFRGRDGCLRDLASVHGSYRRVEETAAAIKALGELLAEIAAERCYWYFDSPVSNSGRLRRLFEQQAEQQGWPWTVELRPDVDKFLASTPDTVATSDGWILDRVSAWVDLAGPLIRRLDQDVYIVHLGT